MKGLTLWICFGSYGGFRIEIGNPTLIRICLGWISIVAMLLDVDKLIGSLAKDFNKLQEKKNESSINC